MEDVFPHQFLKQTKNNRIQFCVCKRIRACCHMSLYEMYREKITTKKKIHSHLFPLEQSHKVQTQINHSHIGGVMISVLTSSVFVGSCAYLECVRWFVCLPRMCSLVRVLTSSVFVGSCVSLECVRWFVCFPRVCSLVHVLTSSVFVGSCASLKCVRWFVCLPRVCSLVRVLTRVFIGLCAYLECVRWFEPQ